jgi:hypothetical protein
MRTVYPDYKPTRRYVFLNFPLCRCEIHKVDGCIVYSNPKNYMCEHYLKYKLLCENTHLPAPILMYRCPVCMKKIQSFFIQRLL